MKAFWVFFLFIVGNFCWANIDKAWSILTKHHGDPRYYPNVVKHLVEADLYYVAVPYIKEYLTDVGGVKSRRIDNLIDKVITNVGVRQFEVLPTKILLRSSAPTVRYITAKKYFRTGKYNRALKLLNGTIPTNHPAKPFALFLEASIFSIQKKYKSAVTSYRGCVRQTKSQMNGVSEENRLRQLAINRDYCLVGIGRSQFAAGKYNKANLSYLDLPKDSFIWPEILFEEAWNSFYQKDYNRTLGKLVTYKAPIMKVVFNPEIEVLGALTYMELCLWSDARKVVDDFYKNYQEDSLAVKTFLRKHGRNYKYYYLLAKSYNNGRRAGNELLNKLLDAITKDAAYLEIKYSFNRGKEEIRTLKSLSRRNMRSVFTANLREALVLQRDLIGAYVRKGLQLYSSQLDSSFKGMSYIKLEVLGREKSRFYGFDKTHKRERGDIKYLKRNEKQYFWSFNGEFWADELGDYVFSLKSECS